MKIGRKILTAALLAALGIGGAQAQSTTTFHIAGAQVYRVSVNSGIGHILNSGFKVAYVSASQAKSSNQLVFTGTTTPTYGSIPVVIKVDYAGAASGLYNTATTAPQSAAWLPTGQASVAGTFDFLGALSGGSEVSATYDTDNAAPDATIADSYQVSSPTPTGTADPALTAASTAPLGVLSLVWIGGSNSPASSSASTDISTTQGSTSATVTSATNVVQGDVIIGDLPGLTLGTAVTELPSGTTITLSQPALATTTNVPVKFVYTGLTNITNQSAFALFKNGNLPLAQLSGSPGDTANVYLTGRGPNAGARTATVQEAVGGQEDANLGNPYFSVDIGNYPFQYAPLNASSQIVGVNGSGPVAAFEPWPADSNAVPFNSLGENYGGYENASQEAAGFAQGINSDIGYYVGYIDSTDAPTAITGGAAELSYNGVYYSTSAVENGQYTLWSFTHEYYLSTLGSNQKTIANALSQEIAGSDAALSGVTISDLEGLSRHVLGNNDGLDGAVVY
jgi:hypothetical protein